MVEHPNWIEFPEENEFHIKSDMPLKYFKTMYKLLNGH